MSGKKDFVRLISAVTSLMLVLSLTGCAGERDSVPAEDASAEDTEIVSDDDSPETFRYSFDPHVISKEYSIIYGEGIEKEFFDLCDAVLSGSESFPCPSRERFYQLLGIADTCLPLACALIDESGTYVRDGVCHLAYLFSDPELTEKTERFKAKVTEVITTAIPCEGPDFIYAMELYTAVAKKDTYDESCTLDDFLEIGTYRAIMEDTGICQEISGEYIYYLLQVGINAIPCSSLNRDGSEAHEWALADLNGKYYHIDPTYAAEYPDSLFFFAMDDRQREYYGDLPPERYTYADSDRLDREQYRADDRSFADFWLAEEYEIDRAGRTIFVKDVYTGDEHVYDYPLS